MTANGRCVVVLCRARKVEFMKSNEVPFLDLVIPHLEMEDELVRVFRAGLRAGAFVGGAPV